MRKMLRWEYYQTRRKRFYPNIPTQYTTQKSIENILFSCQLSDFLAFVFCVHPLNLTFPLAVECQMRNVNYEDFGDEGNVKCEDNFISIIIVNIHIISFHIHLFSLFCFGSIKFFYFMQKSQNWWKNSLLNVIHFKYQKLVPPSFSLLLEETHEIKWQPGHFWISHILLYIIFSFLFSLYGLDVAFFPVENSNELTINCTDMNE